MATFIIEGGHRLSGSITPQGAKNEALQILSAVLLTDKAVRISNVPEILDVKNLIGLLEEMGPGLRMPYSEHLGEGIFELRTEVGSDITRVLYFFIEGRKAILTHGFVKKTQKTPAKEIERAKRYRKDYLTRCN